jgi:hypothetical protein
MILTVNGDYFLKQRQPVDLCNGEELCFFPLLFVLLSKIEWNRRKTAASLITFKSRFTKEVRKEKLQAARCKSIVDRRGSLNTHFRVQRRLVYAAL